ncbi:hemicentin-1-like [Ruditapes philippinarum]|uniref:hemicentin-1-like n=1 Tax=Ruditapes philippinarum TaxID=129788 RepID=UPI00295C21AE|nr:hemicentin-1-like [Ruditapes philippinarum]
MGCTGSQQCGGVAGAGPGIVGRSVQKKQSSECHECCSTDSCNSLLCQHSKPTSCRDDETVDCAKMNSLFHICADIHQASLVCPQFCNLCGVVDGSWSRWSSWSSCDVTCSSGSQTRLRNCSDPAPAGGGLDCVGNASDIKICKNDACPVHGGWSQWTTWGSCSVSCGVGMQRRDRSCSKPYPALFGDHCFGDSKDDRVCIPGACTDGVWSNWGSWGSCSHSCGGGIKSRSRTCTNPRPSMLGRYCDGDSNQMTPCSRTLCPDKKIAFYSVWYYCNWVISKIPTGFIKTMATVTTAPLETFNVKCLVFITSLPHSPKNGHRILIWYNAFYFITVMTLLAHMKIIIVVKKTREFILLQYLQLYICKVMM